MSKLGSALRKFLVALGIAGAASSGALAEGVKVARARGDIAHYRPRETVEVGGERVPAYRDERGDLVPGRRWVAGPSGDADAGDHLPDPRDYAVIWSGVTYNVKTTAGIDFTFSQTYNSTAAAQTNGLAWIALSNDSLTENTASTTLSNEIAANGLTRAKGTYAHSNGASTATVSLTFTCATSSQAAQKAALFSAASTGTMHHVLSFTQRTLQVGDTLAITFTITLT